MHQTKHQNKMKGLSYAQDEQANIMLCSTVNLSCFLTNFPVFAFSSYCANSVYLCTISVSVLQNIKFTRILFKSSKKSNINRYHGVYFIEVLSNLTKTLSS